MANIVNAPYVITKVSNIAIYDFDRDLKEKKDINSVFVTETNCERQLVTISTINIILPESKPG